MRNIKDNSEGSAWPVVIFIIILAIASVLILLMGEINEPFLNLMDFTDTDINPTISAPREGIVWFFTQVVWPKGVLLIILIGSSLALFMEYQKKQYKET